MIERNIIRFINNFLEDINEEQDAAELTQTLVNRALKNEEFNFEFIRCIEDYQLVRNYRKMLKRLLTAFKVQRKVDMTEYRKLIRSFQNTSNNTTYLYSVAAINVSLDFYENEIETLSDMLQEFGYYTRKHLREVLFDPDHWREEDDCIDYRKEEIFE